MEESVIHSFAKALNAGYPGTAIFFGEPMSRHTTFRVGGTVSLFAEPKSLEAFVWAVRELTRSKLDFMVVGNGSNLLFSDKPHDMVVLGTARLDSVRVSVDSVISGAGVLLPRLGSAALDAGLTGLEFAHGIPGSLGGGVYMNAGAYGGELKDVVEAVTYLDKSGALRTVSGADCGFAYRHSRFENSGDTILSATLRLRPGDPKEIKARMDDLSKRRREKQPLNYPSAGSTFKRPEGDFAARLIEEAGLKGCAVGGAQVSEKHAGFIVNTGSATFEDVFLLIQMVQSKVYDKTGVRLEPEVRIIP